MFDGEIRELLEELHDRYNTPDFVADDPVSIPHRFGRQEDIEVAGFLAATTSPPNYPAVRLNGLR